MMKKKKNWMEKDVKKKNIDKRWKLKKIYDKKIERKMNKIKKKVLLK